jgi:biopolymer transport protein ExbD
MRFKNRQSHAKLPEVNLIPMLDVLMTVLTFFIILSILLGSETLIDVQLPAESQSDTPTPLPADPFIVELVGENDITLNGQPIAMESLAPQMEAYLRRNPKDTIFLLPNPDLPYEQVMQFLGEMRRIGGDRVSLAIEEG